MRAARCVRATHIILQPNLYRYLPVPPPQIRANSLSGDCSWGREIQRGILSFSKQHQVGAIFFYSRSKLNLCQTCVRRRAVMSVMANPNCPDKESAERAVNEVWESCFNDTRPFDEVRLTGITYTFSWQSYMHTQIY